MSLEKNMKFINPYKLFVGAFIPNWLMERTEVSQGAKLLYARLAQYAGQHGEAWPGQDVLANALGVSDRQVRTYLTELEELKLIVSTKIDYAKSNHYRFRFHPWMQATIRKNTSGLSGRILPPKRISIRESSGSGAEHKETCICTLCLAGNPPFHPGF